MLNKWVANEGADWFVSSAWAAPLQKLEARTSHALAAERGVQMDACVLRLWRGAVRHGQGAGEETDSRWWGVVEVVV